MAPIEDLRSQGDRIEWLEEHTVIFRKIKEILNEKVMLSYPDFNRELIIATDASKYGIGCMLYQIDDNKQKRYIRFASRSMSKSERNYGAPQRELLGVLYALRSFHNYVYGRRFKLYTDHQALTFMLKRTKLSSVIQNWMDEIMQYDFEMIHLPGISNHLPDVISRIYDFDPREEGDESTYVLVLAQTEKEIAEALKGDEQEDSRLEGHFNESLEDLEELTDLELRTTFIKQAHLAGHVGAADMARGIRSLKRVNWPSIIKDCQNYVKACIPCQRYNIGKHGYHPPKNVMALMPFDHLAIDLKEMPQSAKGNNYYLLVIDIATRFVFIRPMPDKSMFTLAQTMFRLCCDFGFPKIVQSDNGTEFVNGVLDALKKLSKIDGRLIAPYHHRGNGVAERAIKTTPNMIYKAIEGLIHQWDDYAPSSDGNTWFKTVLTYVWETG